MMPRNQIKSASNTFHQKLLNISSPKAPEQQPIFEYVKGSRALEKMQEFLKPFRLPKTLKISARGCDGEADTFYDGGVITICYEYLDELWKNAPAETTSFGLAPIDALLGPLYDTSVHEFGHTLFDMFNIPVLGREEDAADQVAAYISLQLGKTEARRLITGTVYAFKLDAARGSVAPPLQSFADEHSTPAQRAYNLLCIAYGADPTLFNDVLDFRLRRIGRDDRELSFDLPQALLNIARQFKLKN